jgi:hypothetical protein
MGLDIRLPIGGLFTVIGLLLVSYGLLAGKAIYQASLGINVNFWWGLVMLGFGLIMITFSRRADQRSTR